MVDNKIIRIIHSNLNDYVNVDNIKFYPNNGFVKYEMRFKSCCIDIIYYPVDNYYRIKFEKKYNNQLQNIVLVSKSKKYHKDIKKLLKVNKLSSKSFENHIICFTYLLSKLLSDYGDLVHLEKYVPDLKFDGIFI